MPVQAYRPRIFTMGLALVLGLLTGCGDTSAGGGTPVAADYTGCDQVIEPGSTEERVQEALIQAAPNSTVCLGPGTFAFTNELSITQEGVTLRGQGQGATVLSFEGQIVGANGLQITSDGVTLEGFTVENTPGDGIRATSVKDITFRKVSVHWETAASVENGAYGLYPVDSEGVVIDGCVVSGARDAGVYVGQSRRVLVMNSEAYGNVAGFELENTIEAEAYGNRAHDNTAGFLVFSLPGLPVQNGGIGRSLVHDNTFENNDALNFAEPGTFVSKVPPGCGMVLLSTDQNEITKNVIRDNGTTGIFIASFSDPLIGTTNDTTFDPFPEGNYIHDNTFVNNGTEPAGTIGALVIADPVPDVLWDGCVDPMKDNSTGALTNCLMNNGGATFANMGACIGFMETTDIGPVTCEGATVVPEGP
jgi:parallel beta-helix repeat protein